MTYQDKHKEETSEIKSRHARKSKQLRKLEDSV